MKRVYPVILLALLLSGCFEINFNFKTIVHQNGKIDREVQINGEGADRFLPPSDSQWEIKTAESKLGKSILGDAEYHIHATGHFLNPAQFTSDFRYDIQSLISGLTDEKRNALVDELKIPEPLEKEIGTGNRIQLQKKRSLFSVEYSYTEVFEIRHLVSILLYDLKKDIADDHASSHQKVQVVEDKTAESRSEVLSEVGSQAGMEAQVTSLLEPEKIEVLAQEELREEILPKFHFHSEVTLPGKIVASNATRTHGATAIWDFRAVDFENDFSLYTLRMVSRAPNVGPLIALILAVLAALLAITYSRQKKSSRKNARGKQSNI